jgi:cytochrome b6-f complex iron-sulfur subunit
VERATTCADEPSATEGVTINRRHLLNWFGRGSLLAAAAAATSQILRFLAYEPPDATPKVFPVGFPDAYPRDAVTYVAEARVYIGRDERGIYAVDAVCPHLGCLVEVRGEVEFVCPCHGSRFSSEGRPETGPATQPLRFLHIRLDPAEGQLAVDRSQQVEPAARLSI